LLFLQNTYYIRYTMEQKLSLKEKIAYALGDASANIAWRGVSTFLIIFYTDVFGLTPATVGTLMLVARTSDGVSDVLMGVVGDRTQSKYGKFRPWILWSALPLGIILSLLFTCPESWSIPWKIAYAYTTYILFTLIYTANNIPYGALMAVMTGDDKERTSIGSFRMVGAFAGGMLVQGTLLFLVTYFGNINPEINLLKVENDKYQVSVSAQQDVKNVNIKTEDGIATFQMIGDNTDTPTFGKSFSVKAGETYKFMVEGEENLTTDKITLIDQSQGYSKAIYTLSIFLVLCMFITFRFTKERVSPPKGQKENIWNDLKDLAKNRPWIVLLVVGLAFNIYNNIKQGITVIYFTHYIHNQLLAGGYMTALMVASIIGAAATTPLSRRFGKKNVFIGSLVVSGVINSTLMFCGPQDKMAIFVIGSLSECAAAIMPTLFFAMLGDAADYSEFANGRRATGLVYSAGSFATKFGGGIAGAIIGLVLGLYGYNGQDSASIEAAVPGIIELMSWIPAIIAFVGAVLMLLYPLNQQKMTEITTELSNRREQQKVSI